jgi:L1 cell adhesion molecule like protein
MVLVGEAARQQQRTNPLNTFCEFKRVIGRTYEQRALWRNAKHWAFALLRPEADESPEPRYSAMHCGEFVRFTALDLTTVLITEIAGTLRARLGTAELRALTVTVPAHFDHAQRKQTIQATRLAGFTSCVVSVVNEPSAAMLAYATGKAGDRFADGECVVVVDVGAGTFDVSCVRVLADQKYKVLDSEGASDLGGSDFDERLLVLAAAHYKRSCGADLRTKKKLLVAARAACESAKRTLSVAEETTIHVAESVPPLVITRAEFEGVIAPELRRCVDTITGLLARLGVDTVDHVILCGGSSRVPAVQRAVRRRFPGPPVLTDINVDECVAQGACAHARAAAIGVQPVHDVVSCSIGIRTGENMMLGMAPKNSALPARAVQELLPFLREQEFADICVYQGEDSDTERNVYLGYVRLRGLRPGHPSVYLILEVDVNGLITLDARDDEGHRVVGSIRV